MDINEAKAFLKKRINPNMVETILAAARGDEDNMFHITLTNTGTYAEPIWTCDKTYEEINNAYPNIDCTVIDLDGRSCVCQLPIREEGYITLQHIMAYGTEISGFIVMFSPEEAPYGEFFNMTVGGEKLIVNATRNGNTWSFDKTFEEILAAGPNSEMRYNDNGTIYILTLRFFGPYFIGYRVEWAPGRSSEYGIYVELYPDGRFQVETWED